MLDVKETAQGLVLVGFTFWITHFQYLCTFICFSWTDGDCDVLSAAGHG